MLSEIRNDCHAVLKVLMLTPWTTSKCRRQNHPPTNPNLIVSGQLLAQNVIRLCSQLLMIVPQEIQIVFLNSAVCTAATASRRVAGCLRLHVPQFRGHITGTSTNFCHWSVLGSGSTRGRRKETGVDVIGSSMLFMIGILRNRPASG